MKYVGSMHSHKKLTKEREEKVKINFENPLLKGKREGGNGKALRHGWKKTWERFALREDGTSEDQAVPTPQPLPRKALSSCGPDSPLSPLRGRLVKLEARTHNNCKS